jgi:hypothetical protein
MMGPEQFLCLLDHTLVMVEDFGGGFERSGTIGRDVHLGQRILRE